MIQKKEQRLRWAGILIVIGLLVELATLRWSHPTAFIFYATVGVFAIGAGMLLFLATLLTRSDRK